MYSWESTSHSWGPEGLCLNRVCLGVKGMHSIGSSFCFLCENFLKKFQGNSPEGPFEVSNLKGEVRRWFFVLSLVLALTAAENFEGSPGLYHSRASSEGRRIFDQMICETQAASKPIDLAQREVFLRC